MDIPLARTRLDLVAMVLLVGYAVLLSAVVAAVTALLDGKVRLLVLLVLVVLWLIHVGLYLYSWSRLRKIPSPLGVHGDGVHDRTPFAETVLPWEAIGSVALERRLLRSPLLRVRPVEPDGRQIRWSLRVLDISADELRQLVTVQSGGRAHVA